MKTRILFPSEEDILAAGEILKKGGLVAIPTETVYGLAANAYLDEAVLKIFLAKGRPQDNPLILHIASIAELYPLCASVPETAKKVMERFWPGPLTLLFDKSPLVSDIVTCGLPSVAVRFPSHPVAAAVIRAAGAPLAAPSANLSGRPSATSLSHVLADFDGKIEAVIDGGDCFVGLESTVLDLRSFPPRILRPGGVTFEDLQELLPDLIIDPAVRKTLAPNERPVSPGMKYRHYAPKAPVVIVQGEDAAVISYIQNNAAADCGILCYDENVPCFSSGVVVPYGGRFDKANLAHRLFASLRQFDEKAVKQIFAQCPDEDGLGLAVANRLRKAAAFRIIQL